MLCVLEGFETYGYTSGADLRTELRSKWSVPNLATDWATLVDGASFGKALQWGDNEGSYGLGLPVNVSSTLTMGFAFKHFGCYADSASETLLRFKVGSTIQSYIYLDEYGRLVVYGAAYLAKSDPIPIGTWNYIEIKLEVGNTGSFLVYVNGELSVNQTSVDTQATSTSHVSLIEIWPTRYSCWDDIYVCDDSDGTPVILGPIVIEAVVPTGDDDQDWTPSTGVDHFALVDELVVSDSDYVASTTVNHSDTWTYPNLSEIDGSIVGVGQLIRVGTDAVGVRTLNAICKSNSTTNEVSWGVASDGSFENIINYYPLDPHTSTAWTVTTLNAAEFGVKVGD